MIDHPDDSVLQPPSQTTWATDSPFNVPRSRALIVVGAVLAGLLVVSQVVLSLAAVPFAENSISAFVANQVAPTAPNGELSPSTPTVPKMDGLGIRSLPLVTEDAWSAFQNDPDAAIQTYGARAFGDGWASIWNALTPDANYESKISAQSRNYGAINTPLASAWSDTIDQSTLLDLIALLEFYGAEDARFHSLFGATDDDDSGSRGHASLLAVALADYAATKLNTCDAHLAFAHAFTFVDLSQTDQMWDDADAACPGDPTAKLEKVRANMGTWKYQSGWDAVEQIEQWNLTATDYPNLPASHIVRGDMYRSLANMSLVAGFSERYLYQQAISSYSTAVGLTTDPTPVIALAGAYTAFHDPAAALTTLESLKPLDKDSWTARRVRAAALAQQGDFTGALDENTAAEADTSRIPILTLDTTNNRSFRGPIVISEPSGSSVGFLFQNLGSGGGFSVQDRSFVPISRSTWNMLEPTLSVNDWGLSFQAEYSFMANDWMTQCQTVSDENGICAEMIAPQNPASRAQQDWQNVQDMWRNWGQLDKAAQVVSQWIANFPSSALAYERLGEIEFLLANYDESASASVTAAELYDVDQPSNDYSCQQASEQNTECAFTGPGWALLRAAAANITSDHDDQVNSQLDTAYDRQAAWTIRQYTMSGSQLGLVSTYVALEKAQLAYSENSHEVALSYAIEAANSTDALGGLQTGAAQQLASLSAFALGDYDVALEWGELALNLDPKSPLYQESVADARRALNQNATSTPEPSASASPIEEPTPSDEPTTSNSNPSVSDPARQEVIDAYWSALDYDQTLFSTWNNLGVLYAQDGQIDEALTCFRQAVSVRPEYPLGWFNLGVAESTQSGVAAFLRAQGSFGKAGILDHNLKNQDSVFTFDDQVYSSNLDVSKPIPADWHLSESVRVNSTPITIGFIALIALRIVWALFADWFTQTSIGKALRTVPAKLPKLWAFTSHRSMPLWTTLVSLGSLIWLAGTSGWKEFTIVGIGFAALFALHATAPRLVSRGIPQPHSSVLPASLITLILTPFGLGFAPPAPLVDDRSRSLVARRSGVFILALIGIVFCVVAGITSVPVIRAATVGCLILLTSALIPIKPLDGSQLDLKRWVGWIVTIAMGTYTVLFALGMI